MDAAGEPRFVLTACVVGALTGGVAIALAEAIANLQELAIGSKHHPVEALRAALDNGALSQVYHPQIDFVSGKPVGFEALARWIKPDASAVPTTPAVR